MGRTVRCLASLTLALVLLQSATARADSIVLSSGTFAQPSLSAGSAHTTGTDLTWNYTGNYSDLRYRAYVSTWAGLGLYHSTNMGSGDATSNTNYGPDVPAGTPAYTGVEFYYIAFSLPSDALNISLAFTRQGADDRLQMMFNGSVIGYWGGSGGVGQMVGLGSQPTLSSVTFNSTFANSPTISTQALFNVGGTNVLRFWVNNTGTSWVGAGVTPHAWGNPSALDVRATLTYDRAAPVTAIPTPEPSSLLLLVSGALVGYRRLRAKP